MISIRGVRLAAALLACFLVASTLKQEPLDHELLVHELQHDPSPTSSSLHELRKLELKVNRQETVIAQQQETIQELRQSIETKQLPTLSSLELQRNHELMQPVVSTTSPTSNSQSTGEPRELLSLSSQHTSTPKKRHRRQRGRPKLFFQSLLSKFNAKTMVYWDTEILKDKPLTLPQVKEMVAKAGIASPYGAHKIEHIYYNNLGKNVARRNFTNAYLGTLKSNTGVPFKRLEAKRGANDVCAPKKNKGGRCIGLSGLTYSLLHILNHENVTGPTMVLEDDYVLNDDNFDRLYAAMDMLPDDWDLIRLDCWGMDGKVFANQINPYVVNTTTYTGREDCHDPCYTWFAGGTYSMLWRGRPSTVDKLRQTWSIQPFEDVDARVADDGHRFGLVSYCMNIGLGTLIKIPKEGTDIPKDV